ncbi:MAG: hypothetical protein M3Q10_13600 [Chloroflexota bacterium]|nr:hypothetical protein [Chloroflexota bacterium]
MAAPPEELAVDGVEVEALEVVGEVRGEGEDAGPPGVGAGAADQRGHGRLLLVSGLDSS